MVCLKPYLFHAPPLFRPPLYPRLPDPILSDSPSFRDSRSSLFAPLSSSSPLRNSLVVLVESFVRYRKPLFKFDALVTALPLTEDGEEAQLQKISELQLRSLFSSLLIT
ncbi:hypothetical protein ACS0TY_026187 [Phlomoides rotata]